MARARRLVTGALRLVERRQMPFILMICIGVCILHALLPLQPKYFAEAVLLDDVGRYEPDCLTCDIMHVPSKAVPEIIREPEFAQQVKSSLPQDAHPGMDFIQFVAATPDLRTGLVRLRAFSTDRPRCVGYLKAACMALQERRADESSLSFQRHFELDTARLASAQKSRERLRSQLQSGSKGVFSGLDTSPMIGDLNRTIATLEEHLRLQSGCLIHPCVMVLEIDQEARSVKQFSRSCALLTGVLMVALTSLTLLYLHDAVLRRLESFN